MDQDTVYDAIPETGEIPLRDILKKIYPDAIYKAASTEYCVISTKLQKLRQKRLIRISRRVKNINYYARIKADDNY